MRESNPHRQFQKLLLYHWTNNANLPRSAVPVASYLVRYEIQHSSCLLPCELLNVSSRIRDTHPLWRWYSAFLREQSDSYLPISLQHSVSLAATCESANPLTSHRLALMHILSDRSPNLLPTSAMAYEGGCFRVFRRVIPDLGLYRRTVSGAGT